MNLIRLLTLGISQSQALVRPILYYIYYISPVICRLFTGTHKVVQAKCCTFETELPKI